MKQIFKNIRLPVIVRDFENKEVMILRDYLALERTKLANERTLFSYIRTSIYLILGGIAFIKVEQFSTIVWLGYISIIVSFIMIVFGLVRFKIMNSKLNKFYNSVKKEEMKIIENEILVK